MIQKIKKPIVIVCSLLVLTLGLSPAIASAAIPADPTSGNTNTNSTTLGNGCAGQTKGNCLQQDPIVKDLNLFVNVLSAGVGIVVVGTIILGGIQYSLAGGSPDKIKQARQRITNALLAMVAFMLTFGFLQWIIPGGVFN